MQLSQAILLIQTLTDSPRNLVQEEGEMGKGDKFVTYTYKGIRLVL
jgi:hypothetical protein